MIDHQLTQVHRWTETLIIYYISGYNFALNPLKCNTFLNSGIQTLATGMPLLRRTVDENSQKTDRGHITHVAKWEFSHYKTNVHTVLNKY